jgi:DNA-binding XRE family transcriptional regulator
MESKMIPKNRIENKVELVTESGCWIWMGTTTSRGYGQLIDDNKKYYAHRASYEAFIGEIPKGMYVCHRCDNRFCVNPNHLFVGTQKDNLQDMRNKGRSTRGEKNAQAKLTHAQVAMIKVCLKHKAQKDEQLAKQFGVSRQTINLIKQGKRWNHVS